jgi:NAD(P)-dependent dehydrogenase (short-subunit alcohol dehydrogenase family)
MRFDGKRAFVTGAGSGIGEAVARALHAEGARVTLADVAGDRAQAIAGELGDGRADALALDVRDEAAVRDALPEELDVLANIAGIGSTTCARASRWAGSASRTRSPRRCCTSPRTRRRS